MARILVIEDEARTAREIVDALTAEGYAVTLRADGPTGLAEARAGLYDAITLDRLLPGLDGLALLAELRREGVTTPVLVVSALDGVDDKVRGLRAGGDDYLTKPFALAELVARVMALARRRADKPAGTLLQVGPLVMDLVGRQATRGARELDLTPREFQLLEYFVRNAEQTLTRSMLFQAVWEYGFAPGTNVIDVHVGRLRRKVDADNEEAMIRTVRGGGWRLHAPD
ncbi:response regulator transcription factor [Nitrospirillum sp. BR 11828]|uniref:response regulator transcription factor n=1 Tax=Nitrospirillum sp. BR 11828 TaxID=3104325 RepID=UPI002ACA8279|nr:response regulator transcription factor [Nitrospirillum sp. BR 11828]MDZ5650132.1 response regulator transcription factor [Nitrospirillum sp. BR 11828]